MDIITFFYTNMTTFVTDSKIPIIAFFHKAELTTIWSPIGVDVIRVFLEVVFLKNLRRERDRLKFIIVFPKVSIFFSASKMPKNNPLHLH